MVRRGGVIEIAAAVAEARRGPKRQLVLHVTKRGDVVTACGIWHHTYEGIVWADADDAAAIAALKVAQALAE